MLANNTIEYLQSLLLLCSEEAEALAKKLKLRFYRASVKEDLNVTEGRGWSGAGVCPARCSVHLVSLQCFPCCVLLAILFVFLGSMLQTWLKSLDISVFPFSSTNSAYLQCLEVPMC